MQRSDKGQIVQETMTASAIKERHRDISLFLAGEGEQNLIADINTMVLHFNNMLIEYTAEGEPAWSKSQPTLWFDKLKKQFGEDNARKILAAHNNSRIELLAPILEMPSTDLAIKKIDIYASGQNVYQEVTYNSHSNDDTTIVVKFKLTQNKQQWGYELEEIKITKKIISTLASDTILPSPAAVAAAAAAAAATVTTSSTSAAAAASASAAASDAAAPHILVPAAVGALSMPPSDADFSTQEVLHLLDEIKLAIDRITSIVDVPPIDQNALLVELQKILNAAIRIKIIANNKTSNPAESGNDALCDQITNLFPVTHALYSEKTISVLAAIAETMTDEHGHNMMNICTEIMRKSSINENRPRTLQYLTHLNNALQDIINFIQVAGWLKYDIEKKIKDATVKNTAATLLTAAKKAQCYHPEKTVELTDALKRARRIIDSADSDKNEQLKIILAQITPLNDPFTAFLRENSHELNSNIDQFLSDTSQLGEASRIFNHFKNQYVEIQPLLDTVVEAGKYDKFEDWLYLELFAACHDLLDEKGELKPSIYRLLNATGKLDAQYAVHTKETVNAQIVGSYVNEIVASHASKLATEAFQSELDNVAIPPNKQKLLLFSRIQNDILETLKKINLDEKNKFRQRLVAIANDSDYPAKNLQKAAKTALYKDAVLNLERAILTQPNDKIKAAATNVLTAAQQTAKKHPEKLAEITDALNTTTAVVEKPEAEPINKLYKQAKHFSERSWGRILAGTMVALAGVALIAGFTAAALVTFGAVAPVTILGYVVGASMVAGGLAVAGGAIVGTTYGLGSAYLIHQGAKKGNLSNSLEELAKAAKPKPHR